MDNNRPRKAAGLYSHLVKYGNPTKTAADKEDIQQIEVRIDKVVTYS